MTVEKNIAQLVATIDEIAMRVGRKKGEVALVVVSKGRSVDEMRQAYAAGVRDFGENRLPEALEKMDALPSDIRWHFIGKLQSNKVTKVVGRFALIHSVDSPELAKRIARVSTEKGVVSSILLEANTSGEKTKGGLSASEWITAFRDLKELAGIAIEGLMTMAPLTEDESVIRHCFSELHHLGETLGLTALSMGMSNDFEIAIEEGATLLRIGTAVFTPQ